MSENEEAVVPALDPTGESSRVRFRYLRVFLAALGIAFAVVMLQKNPDYVDLIQTSVVRTRSTSPVAAAPTAQPATLPPSRAPMLRTSTSSPSVPPVSQQPTIPPVQPSAVPTTMEPTAAPFTDEELTLSPSTAPSAAIPVRTKFPTTARAPTNVTYYSVAQTDRTGSQLYTLTLLSAMAFGRHGNMGGACADAYDWEGYAAQRKKSLEKVMEGHEKRLAKEKRAVAALGLQDHFKFECPSQEDVDSGRAQIVDRGAYATHKSMYAQPAWLADFRSHSTLYQEIHSTPQNSTAGPKQVAVHVRRGDIEPCKWGSRYLTNDYYLRVMDEMIHPELCPTDGDCDITIYTEEAFMMEDYNVFLQRNYTVDVNSSVEEIWQAFVKADVLVLSVSSFSYVPSLLNTNIVIGPLKSGNIPHWDTWQTLSQSSWDDSQESSVKKLVAEHCNGTKAIPVGNFKYNWERKRRLF